MPVIIIQLIHTCPEKNISSNPYLVYFALFNPKLETMSVKRQSKDLTLGFFCAMRYALCALRFALCSMLSALYSLRRSAVCGRRSLSPITHDPSPTHDPMDTMDTMDTTDTMDTMDPNLQSQGLTPYGYLGEGAWRKGHGVALTPTPPLIPVICPGLYRNNSPGILPA